jgi:diadenylate cyclase
MAASLPPAQAQERLTLKACHEMSFVRSREVLSALLDLPIEMAREGREGRRIGTLFTLGRADAVLVHSRPLILDALAGHAPHATSIVDANLRGTVKELAQLDGAFVVAEEASCGRTADTLMRQWKMSTCRSDSAVATSPQARYRSVSACWRPSRQIATIVRLFYGGELIAEIIPELWLFRRHIQSSLRGRIAERHVDDLTIRTEERSADQGQASCK